MCNVVRSLAYALLLNAIHCWLQTKGVQVMAVGVGSGADNNELRSIAMENPENVMKLSSSHQLADGVKNLTRKMCQGNVLRALP